MCTSGCSAGWGAFDDANAVDVRIRYSAKAAPFILERAGHRSQVIEPLEDGGILQKLRVPCTPEVEFYALRWPEDMEVLEPQSLRERMWEVGACLQRAHGGRA